MKKRAEFLIRQSLTGKFWRSPAEKKDAVTCVICLLVLKEYSKPGTISDICNACQISRNLFAKAYYQYVAAYPRTKLASQNEESGTSKCDDLVKEVVRNNFKGRNLTNDLEAIEDRACQLVRVFHAHTVKSELTLKPTVHAALFLAWKSMHTSRVNFSLKDYQTQLCIKYSPDVKEEHIKKRLSKFQNCLVDLAKNLEWLKLPEKQLKKNISLYIKDILSNSSHLIYEIKMCEEEEAEVDVTPVEDVDGDAEISDREIECYLRTDDEIAVLERAKSSLGSKVTSS